VRRWIARGAPSAAQLEEIAALLRSGGVVLLPTDTVYGLHAVASDDRAVARIAKIKGRAERKPFITLAASIADLQALGAHVPKILHEIWPAPLTAILECGALAPLSKAAASRRTPTIAARVPDLDWLRSLLSRSGPLVSTSANRSGEPPIRAAQELTSELEDALDGVLQAGFLNGKPSAIVDFTGTEPRVIREGESRFTQNLRKRLRKSL
jgi:L-threonylcarbamoyladenylate synthase